MVNRLDNISTILFDFDGTIANTIEAGVTISNELSDIYGYKRINNQEELEYYRGLSTRVALLEIGMPLLKLPLIATAFRKRMSGIIMDIKPFESIVPTIERLSRKYDLAIITSNSEVNLNAFLNKNNLDSFFQHQFTGINLFGKSHTIKKFVKKHKLDCHEVLMIGDETRDIHASKKCGLRIASVCWGFHHEHLLESCQPDYIVHRPSDLLTLLGA